MKIKLGVLFGGPTTEHEISIITAVQAMGYLDEEKYDIIPIYITKERQWYTGEILKEMQIYRDMDLLKRYAKKVVLYNNDKQVVLQTKGLLKRILTDIDIVMPIVHGYNMEDGNIQGYLDIVGVPYTGSDIYGAVVGQDKVFMKQIFDTIKLPITKYEWFYDFEYKNDKDNILNKVSKLKYPLIIKPARLGSSVGISKANNIKELEEAIDTAINYDEKILVEEVVNNLVELNCSVLGNSNNMETSVIEQVMGSDAFLSYEDKYISGGKKSCKKGAYASTEASKGILNTSRIIPAKINKSQEGEISNMSKEAFKILGASGVVRIDYLMDKETKKIYINELNTIPGSLSFYLWEPKNKNYSELLDDIINISIKRFKEKEKKTYSFDTNVLQNFNGLKGSKGKLKFNNIKK